MKRRLTSSNIIASFGRFVNDFLGFGGNVSVQKALTSLPATNDGCGMPPRAGACCAPTDDDAYLGKVTFKAEAQIRDARDALPADNEAISRPVRVMP